MQLSAEAIKDLRQALNNSFGENFSTGFSDTEISEIGILFLTILAEGLKQQTKVA